MCGGFFRVRTSYFQPHIIIKASVFPDQRCFHNTCLLAICPLHRLTVQCLKTRHVRLLFFFFFPGTGFRFSAFNNLFKTLGIALLTYWPTAIPIPYVQLLTQLHEPPDRYNYTEVRIQLVHGLRRRLAASSIASPNKPCTSTCTVCTGMNLSTDMDLCTDMNSVTSGVVLTGNQL